MMSSSDKNSSKMSASVDSLKLSTKTSLSSSKHASSESVLPKKESIQMQECKKRLLKPDASVLIRDESVALKSPTVKKLTMVAPPDTEELAAATPAERNWRGILIALLVIAAVLGLIVFSIALLTPAGTGGRVEGRRPTRAEILSSKFKYKPFNGTWINDVELVYRDSWGGLAVLNADNLTTRQLMSNSTFRELNAVDFLVSSDLKFVLLISDVRPGYRYARLARYYVYEFATRHKFPLSHVEEDRRAPLLQYATWSPDGAAVAFVHDNDVYYKPKILKPLICRITSNGIPGVVFNGVPDFLYETEVMRMSHALWFAPDSTHLMYASFNASQVKEYKYPWYGVGGGKEPLNYPEIRSIRYPKSGTRNPDVTLYTVDLKPLKHLFPAVVRFPDIEPDSYLRYAVWVSEKQIGVLHLSRSHNTSVISTCRGPRFNCQEVIREVSDVGWSSLGEAPSGPPFLWSRSGAGVVTLSAVPDGVHGRFTHVVHAQTNVTLRTPPTPLAPPTPLTLGQWEVTKLLAWDEDNGLVYFMATPEKDPGERHLYRVRARSAAAGSEECGWSLGGVAGCEGGVWPEPDSLQCMSCPTDTARERFAADADPMTEEEATQDSPSYPAHHPSNETANTTSSWPDGTTESLQTVSGTGASPYAHLNAWQHRGVFYVNDTFPNNCLYNNIIFSKNNRYFIQECLGPEPPSVYLSESLRNVRVWVACGGAALRGRVRALAAARARVFRVEVRPGRPAARVRLLLPPGLRDQDDLPLPLLLQLDGSPGSQLISEKFQIDWGWYLASTRNFIVAQIDARGSGFQGEDFRRDIYQRLMSVEVEDQIAVLTYIRDNLKIVDESRIGVWGVGYGGGVAAMMAAEDTRNLTRCTALVSPITDWALHNTYFTERYLGGARAAWEAASAARRAGNLGAGARRLLLAHATADSRVHAQHALALAAQLVTTQTLFSHQVYPDEDHSMSGVTQHLHRQLEDFFDDCFGPVDLSEWDVSGEGLFAFRE